MAEMRRCIGSTKFGIEAHEAPVGDFPVQPSRPDGLGRMCRPHWTEYTRALRKAALARQGADREARFNPGSARARAARKAAARGAAHALDAITGVERARAPKKATVRPVPKPAQKPARGRQAATKREAEAVVEADDGGVIAREAFGRERKAELGRAAPSAEEPSIA